MRSTAGMIPAVCLYEITHSHFLDVNRLTSPCWRRAPAVGAVEEGEKKEVVNLHCSSIAQ